MPVNQKVMAAMKRQYGDKKGEQVYYASLNAGKIKESDLDDDGKETMRRIREIARRRPR